MVFAAAGGGGGVVLGGVPLPSKYPAYAPLIEPSGPGARTPHSFYTLIVLARGRSAMPVHTIQSRLHTIPAFGMQPCAGPRCMRPSVSHRGGWPVV